MSNSLHEQPHVDIALSGASTGAMEPPQRSNISTQSMVLPEMKTPFSAHALAHQESCMSSSARFATLLTLSILVSFCVDRAVAQSAPLPAGSCFEIIAAQGAVQPAILLDKCSGRTWQLVRRYSRSKGRRAHVAYRWSPLSRGEVAARPAIPKPAVARRAPGNSKCFFFDNRKFCE
jgi:hypothetical protein